MNRVAAGLGLGKGDAGGGRHFYDRCFWVVGIRMMVRLLIRGGILVRPEKDYFAVVGKFERCWLNVKVGDVVAERKEEHQERGQGGKATALVRD